MTLSAIFKRSVLSCGGLPWWENRISQWPYCISYHVIGDDLPPLLLNYAIPTKVFDEQIRALRKRYHFLTWKEYKEIKADPKQAKKTVLLTMDDGFRVSWKALLDVASRHKIPSISFVNTRNLDNAYLPWHMQFYFLNTEAGEKFLEPLWKSIGRPPSPSATRRHLHLNFSLSAVVAPLEEGLKRYGVTPEEVAQRYSLYISAEDLRKREPLMEIGNHSHSHFVLSKLRVQEFDEELQSSHEILKQILGYSPECFAPPFGGQIIPFDNRCLERLRHIADYKSIFVAHESPHDVKIEKWAQNRISFDQLDPHDAIATASQISPRYLWKWLAGK